MTGQVDTGMELVKAMLDSWGRTFKLHTREPEPCHETTLYRAGMRGGKSTGDGIPREAMAMEDAVRAVHAQAPVIALALRAFYCGSGRRSVERFQDFKRLAGRKIAKRVYFESVSAGQGMIRAAWFK